MTDLDERLTLAFADLFAEERYRFPDGVVAGGPGYFGVRAAAVTADGAEVELAVTFRAGVRYCCFEPACHAAFYREDWWERLRVCLDQRGLRHLQLPVVRTFRGVVERDAVAEPGTNPPACFVSERSEYQTGPWVPLGPTHADPGATAVRGAGSFRGRITPRPARPLISVVRRERAAWDGRIAGAGIDSSPSAG